MRRDQGGGTDGDTKAPVTVRRPVRDRGGVKDGDTNCLGQRNSEDCSERPAAGVGDVGGHREVRKDMVLRLFPLKTAWRLFRLEGSGVKIIILPLMVSLFP